MMNISRDISGKIEQSLVETLNAVNEMARMLDIPFFLVGASARDIVFSALFNITTIRATLDLDLAIRVENWVKVQALIKRMLSSGLFTQDKQRQHRFVYKDSVFLDIIPFGELEKPPGFIKWPPKNDVIMSTIGFEDAFQSAISVRLSSDLDLYVWVCTPSGLAILKLIAWNEKYPERDKDAKDLLFLMEQYLDAGNDSRLNAEDSDLMDIEDFDYGLAGARLLGRDMAKIAAPETRSIVINILKKEINENSDYRLVLDMLKGQFDMSERFEQTLTRVKQLYVGFLDHE
jgi:predicted nucleotidyltransferase